MFITDLNGKQIEVTNLEEAIKQADICRNCYHEDPIYAAFDKDR